MNNTDEWLNGDAYVVRLTAADKRRARQLVRVRAFGNGKGRGVVAARDLPAFTMIGPYPGHRYTVAQHDARRAAGLTDSKYAVDFWRPTKAGAIRQGYIVDPGTENGDLKPEFQAAVTPLLNEPGPRGSPNVIWVWNLPRYRLEMWTFVPVAAGSELTICYGTGGGYSRSYLTACVGDRQALVEPQLHVVTRAGARPVPYQQLGDAGVRAATRRLLLSRHGGPT